MPYCESCGETLDLDDAFCAECGSAVDEGVRWNSNAVSPFSSGVKRRHVALTAYLWFMIVMGAVATILYTWQIFQLYRLAEALGVQVFDNWRAVILLVMTIAYAVDIVAPVALLKWRRWGFWYFAVGMSFAFVFNIAIGMPGRSVLNLIGIGILFALLQIGGDKRAWSQLV
jgi:predicted amidophosphoribosyltransferase